jgi:hypothetical protein
MSGYGILKEPSDIAKEVFQKTLENNPDADMRAIPHQWLLNERGISGKLGDMVDDLEAANALLESKLALVFDGHAVYCQLSIKAKNFVSPEAVSEVLDALNRASKNEAGISKITPEPHTSTKANSK